MSELVILVPVLGRPWRVAPLLDSIRTTTPPSERVLFIADSDDEPEIQALEEASAACLKLKPPVNWARKVNTGYRATSEPFLFLAADDVEFQPHWYEQAMALMEPGVGIVGTIDLCNRRTMRGDHSTHMLIRRSYIEEFSGVADQPNVIVHEGYPHEYADDELIQTAMARGVYAHAYRSIVQHRHPLVGHAEDDDTYRLGRSQTELGKALFLARRHLWQMSPS